MTPTKPRLFLVVLATTVASQNGVVAAGDPVRNFRTRPSAEQRLLPVVDHPIPVQIALVFGARILDYVFNLCEGRIDFLERLSDNLLMIIISYLDIDDIASLSFTSHRFSKLCMSDRLWEPIVEAANEITPAMKALAQDHSWRQTFFTKKLQLRKKKRISENRAGNQ
uniref:F-box protein 36 n=1 Tax=Pipistrellus kuhlii TaxID=59472 RepID=A0A7J7XV26_PIPKU|nr:F-box protein 36 [Pipistrellus kuhlii]